MVAGLLHGTPGAGGLTSGGTESIFMSVLVARETAREEGIADPVLVTGITAHPAFAKACHLLGMRQIRVPVDEGYRLVVEDDARRRRPGHRDGRGQRPLLPVRRHRPGRGGRGDRPRGGRAAATWTPAWAG